jgi:hypothetical protein
MKNKLYILLLIELLALNILGAEEKNDAFDLTGGVNFFHNFQVKDVKIILICKMKYLKGPCFYFIKYKENVFNIYEEEEDAGENMVFRTDDPFIYTAKFDSCLEPFLAIRDRAIIKKLVNIGKKSISDPRKMTLRNSPWCYLVYFNAKAEVIATTSIAMTNCIIKLPYCSFSLKENLIHYESDNFPFIIQSKEYVKIVYDYVNKYAPDEIKKMNTPSRRKNYKNFKKFLLKTR